MKATAKKAKEPAKVICIKKAKIEQRESIPQSHCMTCSLAKKAGLVP